METFLIKAAQLVLALAILIVIHEFGHFLFARIFGVKVEKFYIFFNPLRSLFKWKPGKHVGSLSKVRCLSEDGKRQLELEEQLEKAAAELEQAEKGMKKYRDTEKTSLLGNLKITETVDGPKSYEEAKARLEKAREAYDRAADLKLEADKEAYGEERRQSRWKRFWRNTEYGVGWVPLGGYCKISGMIDESMDTEQLKREPQPWEFRTKPAWQRLLIMVAGVLFNFLLAILIYAGIVYATGEKYVPLRNAEMGMLYSGEARKAGFRNGDRILSIDGREYDDPTEARMNLIQAKEVTVERDGEEVTLTLPDDFIFRLDAEAKSDTASIQLMTYRLPAQVLQVMPGGGAHEGGVKEGDRVVAVDHVPARTLDRFMELLHERPGREVVLTVARGQEGRTDTLSLDVELDANARMGIGLEVDPSKFYEAKEKRYSLLSAVPRGIEMGTDRLSSYASSMKLVFTKEGVKSVGGFGSIGAIFPEKWDWLAFWNIAAFLSVALAFMNILPIPALDGGHILFLLYEVVTRRKPSQKFMEYAQMGGMILLIALLLYANGMDIVRFFGK